MLKIGFVLQSTNWTGGKNYFVNLFAALKSLPNPLLEPLLVTGLASGVKIRSDFPDMPVIETPLLDGNNLSAILGKCVAAATSRNVLFELFLRKHGICALSHFVSSGMATGKAISSIGWIPDFQHIHLSQFFSTKEKRLRDRRFLKLCAACSTVLVSSECARKDLARFAPRYAEKAAVLRFVATPLGRNRIPSIRELQQKYGFDEEYCLLPNQFWAHKNHRVVISALEILKQRQQRVLVLATGLTHDYRNPSFYPELLAFVKQSGVSEMFRILGPIPYDDLAGLMLNTLAFVNPSRFEGWSTSVEEAKSMGKRVVLSDIPVHREQAPEYGSYFGIDDAESLANALFASRRDFDSQQDAENQQIARAGVAARQAQFAESYQQIVLNTIQSPKSRIANRL